MNSYLKVAFSIAGIFLGGVTQYYNIHYAIHPEIPASWLPLVMAGLTPLAGYFVGLYQSNPLPGGDAPQGNKKP